MVGGSIFQSLRNVLTCVQYRIEDLELPVIHPKMSFITGALDKEIRLSFAQRIKGTLPDPYQALILEGKEKDTPDFKYASDCTFATPSLVVLLFTDLSQQHPTLRKAGRSCNSSARRLRTKKSSP
jgi:MIF4G domain-containing protein